MLYEERSKKHLVRFQFRTMSGVILTLYISLIIYSSGGGAAASSSFVVAVESISSCMGIGVLIIPAQPCRVGVEDIPDGYTF